MPPSTRAQASRWMPPRRTTSATCCGLKTGDSVLVFNGRDGEWRARSLARRESARSALDDQPRTRDPEPRARSALPVRAAQARAARLHGAEGGRDGRLPPAARASPGTPRSRASISTRMRANAIEAAEQCGILTLPEIGAAAELRADDRRAAMPAACSCSATRTPEVRDPVAALAARLRAGGAAADPARGSDRSGGRLCRRRSAPRCCELPNAVRLALGPRILRADTAAVAALALVGAVLGDWR